MIKRRRQPRLTVTASDDSRFWPNPEADFLEQAPILLRAATGEENSRAIDFRWQLRENLSQTFGRCQTQVRRRQFSLIQNAKFWRRLAGNRFHQHPGGFRATALNSEDALTGFHDSLCLAAFPAI